MEVINLSVSQKTLIKRAWDIRVKNFYKTIEFDIPRSTIPISLTGTSCDLNCSHCGGHYLKNMKCINKVQSILDDNYKSCLISGGCNPFGHVDFSSKISQINAIKKTGKRINIHTGLVDTIHLEELKAIADTVSFDFLVDDETIRTVYGIEKTSNDYIHSYKLLYENLNVIPHVCIGLLGGKIKGEYQAIDKLTAIGARRLVFIVFVPTPNTKYQNCVPPKIEEVIDILCYARNKLPDIPINLGCMRPKGTYRNELDFWAVECGLNKIVNPTPKAVNRCKSLGMNILYGEECCTL